LLKFIEIAEHLVIGIFI